MHVWCMYLCSSILTLKHAFMYDVYIYDPWSWYMHIWCIYLFLDPWLWYMCVWCTYIWSWTLILKHACMYGTCIYDAANFVTDEQGDSRSRIHDPDTCMYDAYIYDGCIHEVMHVSVILDPDTCMYDAYINVPWSLTLMHVCMMDISMILDPWLWCMCVWCTYLWS